MTHSHWSFGYNIHCRWLQPTVTKILNPASAKELFLAKTDFNCSLGFRQLKQAPMKNITLKLVFLWRFEKKKFAFYL